MFDRAKKIDLLAAMQDDRDSLAESLLKAQHRAKEWEDKYVATLDELVALKKDRKPQDELEAEVAKLRAEIRIITMEFQAVLNHQGQKAQEAIEEVMKQANEKLAGQNVSQPAISNTQPGPLTQAYQQGQTLSTSHYGEAK